MKKILLVFTILMLISGGLFAQEEEKITIFEPAFKPIMPEIIAQGDSFTAVAEGYGALFTNPAGFAKSRKDLTLVAANPWIIVRPDKVVGLVEDAVKAAENGEDYLAENSSDIISLANNQITSNGLGFGVSSGIGWVGGGLGLGVVNVTEIMLRGKTLTGVQGDLHSTLGVIAGLAIPFDFGELKLTVGADVRPMIRLRAPLDNDTALNLVQSLLSDTEGVDPMELLNSVDSYFGTAFAVDMGATLELFDFSVGLSVRDFAGTRFKYNVASFEENLGLLETFFQNGEMPELIGKENIEHIIPMNISLGAAWHPDLEDLSFLIDPQVHVDLQDPIGVIRDGRSPWTLLHIGAEVRLLRLFNVRAGLNQGYITVGGGIDFPGLNINVAAFSRELGRYANDKPSAGITMEVAVRF